MLLHMDGFDSYESNTDLTMEYSAANMYLNFNLGRWGNNSLTPYYYGAGLSWTSPNPLTEIWTGMAFTVPSQPTENYNLSFFSMGSTSGIEIDLTFNLATFVWSVYRGTMIYTGSTQFIDSVTYPIVPNVYHWMDIHYIISPSSSGVFELWIDGTQIINVTGSNTTQFGSTTFNIVTFGGDFGNPCLFGNIDDIYILDTTGTYNNTRLGDSRIDTSVPEADGSINDGTPYQQNGLPYYGPNYRMVNELYWSNYNVVTLTNTVGQEELYYMTIGEQSPITSSDQIHAVRVVAVTNASDSNNIILANTIVISSGFENDGNSTALTTSYSHVTNIFETDPNTTNPWEWYVISGIECGFKIT